MENRARAERRRPAALANPLTKSRTASKPVATVPDEPQQVQVILRAVSILRALENRPDGLTLGQIAAAVNLARSTVQRITATLQSEQLLIAASPGSKLRLGPLMRRLGAAAETDTLTLLRPVLRGLSETLGETVDIAAVKGANLVFVDQFVGTQRLRTVSAVGERFPLYCTANGKAYLATLSDQQVTRLIGRAEEFGPRQAHTLEKLLSELAQVRQCGVAYDLEEHSDGICAAGICVIDPAYGPILVSVPIPSTRFENCKKTVAAALLQTKRALQSRIDASR